jgi:metallo-beta-lactamase class B
VSIGAGRGFCYVVLGVAIKISCFVLQLLMKLFMQYSFKKTKLAYAIIKQYFLPVVFVIALAANYYYSILCIHLRMHKIKPAVYFLAVLFLVSCAASRNTIKSKTIYKTKQLVIQQIAPNSFLHTSYKQTQSFGYVPCNGVFVRNSNQVVVFDTPTNDTSALELINFIQTNLNCSINAVVPTHFHDDCLGGLQAFTKAGIPSYANSLTQTLAQKAGLTQPQFGFETQQTIKVGNVFTTATFFGAGHTPDNVVGYFAPDNLLFGGCLVKEVGATKGYLGDAVLTDWAATVTKVQQAYPNATIVVPGHGKIGKQNLLTYTIKLFRLP